MRDVAMLGREGGRPNKALHLTSAVRLDNTALAGERQC